MTQRPRRLVCALTLSGLSAVLSGCVAPSPNSGAYQQNADAALASAVSEARTGVQVLKARVADRATTAYADAVITENESAMGPIEDSFGSPDPPDGRADALREQVLTLLADASDACAAARIAVRRGDPDGMRNAAIELTDVADRMERLRSGLA